MEVEATKTGKPISTLALNKDKMIKRLKEDGECAGLGPFQTMAAESAPAVLFAECFGH